MHLAHQHRVGLAARVPALAQVIGHHRGEVVQVHEQHAVELAHVGRDGAWDREVDQERGAVTPRQRASIQMARVHEPGRVVDAGRDQVRIAQRLRELVERPGPAAGLAHGLLGRGQGAVDEVDPVGALGREVTAEQLARLTRAHHDDASSSQVPEGALGGVDRDARHAERALAEARLGAHLLPRGQGLLEQRPEQGAGGARLLGELTRTADLAEDLGLPEHEAVEA